MFKYEYIDDTPRDFPTLGLRDVKKGDLIESPVEIVSPYVKSVTEKKTKGSET